MAKSDYRIGSGAGLSLAALTKFNPQPRSLGVKATRRTFHSSGAYDEGLYIEFLWNMMESETEYQNVLNQAGILSVLSNRVTINARDQTWVYHRYSGYVYQPLIGEQADWNYFPQNIVMIVRDLEFIA
jgi:hypothetical protein